MVILKKVMALAFCAAVGIYIGFALRPTLYFQRLSFWDVITYGRFLEEDIRNYDSVQSLVATSFLYTTIGGLAGILLGALIVRQPKNLSTRSDSQPSGDSPRHDRLNLSGGTASYDVALSFAGEDRSYAKELAEQLRAANFSVFYDEYEQSTLWGRNLYSHLSDVYQNKARYCVMFISEHYAKKIWTKRERESAQARAFKESSEYILPLRIDDTALPGLEDTVGYIDLRTSSIDAVFKLLSEKLSGQISPSARPTIDSEIERASLHTLPPLSEAARELIAEAAASEDGLVVCTDGYSGLDIRANEREFVDGTSPRSEARWKAALRELCSSGFLEDQGGEGEVFSVTESGYRAADQLKATGPGVERKASGAL